MTKEQIRNWIEEQIKKNPKLAKEYKELKLSRLNTELKANEAIFNRKGFWLYRDPVVSKMIIENRDSIKETESKADEELLIDDFVSKYGGTKSTEDRLNFTKNLDDEDHYIEGVFQDTEYYIRCKEDLDRREARQDKEKGKIKRIYKKGLSKRDYFIKKGKKSHLELLAKDEEFLKNYEDIDKMGPEVIQKVFDTEEYCKKLHCRSLAEISVVDAFDAMGAHPAPKQKEQIDKIIEMHDPAVVESAMQRLIENPTENMRALVRNISEAPVQDRGTLRLFKGLDFLNLVCGAVLTGAGISSLLSGGGFHWSLPIGVADLGIGIMGMIRHTRKTNNLDEKEMLMSGCIQDLLEEVVLQETYDKGMES